MESIIYVVEMQCHAKEGCCGLESEDLECSESSSLVELRLEYRRLIPFSYGLKEASLVGFDYSSRSVFAIFLIACAPSSPSIIRSGFKRYICLMNNKTAKMSIANERQRPMKHPRICSLHAYIKRLPSQRSSICLSS